MVGGAAFILIAPIVFGCGFLDKWKNRLLAQLKSLTEKIKEAKALLKNGDITQAEYGEYVAMIDEKVATIQSALDMNEALEEKLGC